MTQISIRPVTGKKDIKTFIRLPWSLYRNDPNWIPPLLMERSEHLDPKKNPYFDHAEVQLWLAFRGNDCVGRISAQICELHQKRYNDQMGQFGFLEAIDDRDVFEALLQTAGDWLRQRGMKRISGPYSFSINDEMGVLVEGFDRPPCFLMGHALPYYAPQLEALGFQKAKDVFA
ncbi:MAG TPA: N-acetyltransferase, partial [Rhizobiales bacterium]|nr:N-acetyltransferase [Hyphomicrobiales bacterium]